MTSSSPAPDRPAAWSPRACRSLAAIACCCWKPARPTRNPWIHIPLGFAKTYVNPRVNWKFESAPQPQLAGRKLYLPRGKTLGGTSSINGMVYMRGTSCRLRRMAPARLRGLGLGLRAALLQEGREPGSRRRRIPWRRRAAARLRPARPLRIGRRDAGGVRAGRHPAQPRLQRRTAGRLPGITRPPPATGGAGALRRPIWSRRAGAPTSSSTPAPTQRAC